MGDIVSRDQKVLDIPCNSCVHYHFDNMDGFSCAAFVSIPKEILSGDNKHLKPLKDQDSEIVYMKIKD